MTIDQVYSTAITWLKRAIGLCLLAAIAITAIELIGFNVPGFKSIPLSQNTGIGMAGLGFLYSKL